MAWLRSPSAGWGGACQHVGMIDLRSDTVTRPSAGMRRAMADAEVGDDVYGEDPTARRLQELAAELLGKPAALFVPTGTMANQLALLCHCQRGDDVLVGADSHIQFFESGAGAWIAQVNFSVVGQGGFFSGADVTAAIKPVDIHFPQTRLCSLENTHNRAGGLVFPQSDVIAIAEAAHARHVAVHLDGARLWHAAAYTGLSPAALVAPVDSVAACFSKGLGAPVGSVLAGSVELIARATRYRKMLGAGMRQVGVLCAASLYALEHQRERLVDDHTNAKRLALGLAELPFVRLDPARVQTNIVIFEVHGLDAAGFARLAAERGVRMNPVGPKHVRAVTHLDVTAHDIDTALAALSKITS